MNEEVEFYLDDLKESMEKAVRHFDTEIGKLRAGKANPQILDGITIDYYGTPTPIKQISSVGATDQRTLAIQPWEKNMLEPIERAIMKANIGITPLNNGEIIRLIFPLLTEETRKNLVKQIRTEGENTKIVLRKFRRDTLEELKKLKKDGLPEDLEKKAEESVQKLIDNSISKVDQIIEKREKEILTI